MAKKALKTTTATVGTAASGGVIISDVLDLPLPESSHLGILATKIDAIPVGKMIKVTGKLQKQLTSQVSAAKKRAKLKGESRKYTVRPIAGEKNTFGIWRLLDA